MAKHSSFPRPCIITIGVPKGGDCKSWLALNLASRLGCWGHDVVVVDCNQQHDLYLDHAALMGKGIYPRFDVIVHTPLSPTGDQNAKLDLRDQGHRDFIIFDTSQFVEFRATAWAWTHCDLMLMPVTPNTTQRHNYDTALKLFFAMPGQRPPIAAVPCKADVLKNSTPQKMLEDMLLFLSSQGCRVPPFASAYHIPANPMMAAQETRWIFSEVEFNERMKRLAPEFILKVDLTFSWLRTILEEHYGPLPPPRLPEIDFSKGREVLKVLAQECKARMVQGARAVA